MILSGMRFGGFFIILGGTAFWLAVPEYWEEFKKLLNETDPAIVPLGLVAIFVIGGLAYRQEYIVSAKREGKLQDENKKLKEQIEKILSHTDADKISAYKPLLDALINMNQRFYKINNSNSDDEKEKEAALLKNLIPTKFRILKDNNRLNSDVSKQYDVYCDMMESNHLIPDMMESNHLIPDINSYKQMIQKLIDELEKYIPSELGSNLDELKNNVK